jgi:hypothetical protein
VVNETPRGATVVEESKGAAALISTLFVVGGAGLGWLVKAGAGWVADLSWAPFQGPFRLISEITESEPASTIVALAIGAVAGAVVAVLAVADMLHVTLASDHVALRRGDATQRFLRTDISAAYMDGKNLVLVGNAGEELAREKTDLKAADLADAFRTCGFRWSDDDPFAADFTRWVPDTEGLPAGSDALLKARDKALKNGDQDDVDELRAELAKLGVVVRDQAKRQYWRLVERELGQR